MRRPQWLATVWIATLCIMAPVAVLGQNAAVKKLNPFNGKAEAIQQGRTLCLQYGCGACHGVMGGGGMGIPGSTTCGNSAATTRRSSR